jgi:hypothetical protein
MTKTFALAFAVLLNAAYASADCSCFCKVKFTDPASTVTGSVFGVAHIDHSPLATWGNCTLKHSEKKLECRKKCDQKLSGDGQFNSNEWWCQKLGRTGSGYKGGSAGAHYAIGTDNYSFLYSKTPIDCPKPKTGKR